MSLVDQQSQLFVWVRPLESMKADSRDVGNQAREVLFKILELVNNGFETI